MPLEPIFIDSGAIELLVNPGHPKLVSFWNSFPQGARHYISHLVYWEFLPQFDAQENSLARQQFFKSLQKGELEFLPFERPAADKAVRVYQEMKRRLPNTSAGKIKLKDLHMDIS